MANSKKKTPPWLKTCKVILGITVLYIMLIFLMQLIHNKPHIDGEIEWSFIDTLIKVSKVFGWIALIIIMLGAIIEFFKWCFSSD